jgi:hypothetical protein
MIKAQVKIIEKFKKTGRIAFVYQCRKTKKITVSIGGGKRIPLKDAIAKMREILKDGK